MHYHSQKQDGVLQASARIVDRMAELKSLSTDVMKSSQDVGNYNTEFGGLADATTCPYARKIQWCKSVCCYMTTSGTATTCSTTSHTVSIFTSDVGMLDQLSV